MYRLMIKQFLRNKTAVAALLVLLCAGMASIAVGRYFLQQQQSAIEKTAAFQQQHIQRLLKYENKEMGLLLYYLKFAYINPTPALAGLSTGQRDINSSIQTPVIRNLEAQKYDTDIRNPTHLMAGNFDLSFIIIYLFPLAIIALCYNLYSEEKEQGTWPLVKIQYPHSGRYLLQKISIPYLFITGVLLVLYLAAAAILPLTLNTACVAYMINNFLYVSFWFAAALLVISFRKSSPVNAVSLLSTWLLLTILAPAAINNYITRTWPVPESFSTMLKQRDGYHKRWDEPQDSTMALFFKEYPQYAAYKWRQPGFNWLWYYAMQHLGDASAKTESALLMQKLKQREQVSKACSKWLPTLYTQLYNNELAQSNLGNHLQYCDSLTAFHSRLRHYFYPKIFTAAPVQQENWSRFTPVYSNLSSPVNLCQSFYTGLFVLLALVPALIRLNKKSHERFF